MRGKGEENRSCQKHCRITPAYAGKSRLATPPTAASRGSPPPMRGKVQDDLCRDQCTEDHPRLCGEKVQACEISKVMKGSPPPMRGKGVHAEPSAAVIGITPAYAGKSSCGGQTRFPCRDHPRLCGEKLKRQIESKQLKGSPPPMRGKGMRTIKAFPNRRITPAYAGKRNIEFSKRIKQQGSPPPMRGKVDQIFIIRNVIRITPAYAGKRLS